MFRRCSLIGSEADPEFLSILAHRARGQPGATGWPFLPPCGTGANVARVCASKAKSAHKVRTTPTCSAIFVGVAGRARLKTQLLSTN